VHFADSGKAQSKNVQLNNSLSNPYGIISLHPSFTVGSLIYLPLIKHSHHELFMDLTCPFKGKAPHDVANDVHLVELALQYISSTHDCVLSP
jgi:hypothetical protein